MCWIMSSSHRSSVDRDPVFGIAGDAAWINLLAEREPSRWYRDRNAAVRVTNVCYLYFVRAFFPSQGVLFSKIELVLE
jgi:hypothetical protein